MKITLDWIERKTTSTGKEKLDASIITETGEKIDKVTLWSDFPGFATLTPGAVVEGTLSPAKDPRYGPTLYPPKSNLGPKPASLGGIKAAQDRKEQSIGRAQDRKEDSIILSGTARDATLIVTTFYQNLSEEEIAEKWKKWRTWLINNHEEPIIPF